MPAHRNNRKRNRQKWVVLIAALLVLGVTYGLKEYFRTPENISRKQAVAEMTVPQIIRLFENDPLQSSPLYVDKVVIVKGSITGVQATDKPVVLTLGATGSCCRYNAVCMLTMPCPRI